MYMKGKKTTYNQRVKKANTIVKEKTQDIIVDALEANREPEDSKPVIISATDFEPAKEVVKPQDEIGEITIPAGLAERDRMLKQLNSGMGIYVEPEQVNKVIVDRTEEKMNQQHNELRMKLAEQNKPSDPKLTIEHYKTLKKYEQQFWIPFKEHGVLYGLNGNQLNELGNVMHEVFNPGYVFDFWCPYCIGEFLTDLYAEFEKWEAKSREIASEHEYETIIKRDKF